MTIQQLLNYYNETTDPKIKMGILNILSKILR